MEDHCLFEIPLFLRLGYYSKSFGNLWQEYRIVNDYASYNLSNLKIDEVLASSLSTNIYFFNLTHIQIVRQFGKYQE